MESPIEKQKKLLRRQYSDEIPVAALNIHVFHVFCQRVRTFLGFSRKKKNTQNNLTIFHLLNIHMASKTTFFLYKMEFSFKGN